MSKPSLLLVVYVLTLHACCVKITCALESFTVITLFFVKMFSDGTCQKICQLNIILVQKFYSIEGSGLMVANGHSFLDHNNSIPSTRVGGLSI